MSSTTLKTSRASPLVKTKILVLSDTHGMILTGKLPSQSVDLCIHCGDLTEESKLDEFHATLELLHAIEAPLKLVLLAIMILRSTRQVSGRRLKTQGRSWNQG